MDNLIQSLEGTALLLIKLGPVMFISLFGTEMLMQLGIMKFLKPLGKPVAKISNLSSYSALSFLTGIGSMIAAHSMTAQFNQDGKITNKEMIISGVLNTVPFHFKEVLTFHFPIILPLLGLKLCLIYVTAFWLAGLLKLFFVIIYGRITLVNHEEDDAFDALECNPELTDCIPKTFKQLVLDSFNARKKMFGKMIGLLSIVTFIVQFLAGTGALKFIDRLIEPVTSALGLPPAVIAPVSIYIFSPTVGITYMSNLLNDNIVTQFQAIAALLGGGILMVPATRLRRTLPRYMAIFGLKPGAVIGILTMVFSMLARAVLLVLVMMFWEL
ncbi:MJ0871-like [Desulfonema limicola]|uniref:MJ0871-like n=1 Tax=Desulfonema limicola TaxID=45656 RepID=A0A975B6F5_9BACT|nr:hypothetical protein [Desulfonema limicola]QTA79629.1 MJ0871-like [Desulfonema limicola]